MRLSIGAKLAVGFLVVMLLGGLSTWWSYRGLNTLQHRYNALLINTYPVAVAAQQINSEVQAQAQQLMAYAVTRDEAAIDSVRQARLRTTSLLDKVREATAGDAVLEELVTAVADQQTRFNRMVNDIFVTGDSLSSDQLLLAAESTRSVGEGMAKRVEDLVRQLEQMVAAERETVQAEASKAASTAMLLILVALGASVLVVGLAQVIIARPVRYVAQQLEAISSGGGDLTRELRIRTGDELQFLAEAFNQMQRHLAGIVLQVIQAGGDINLRSREVDDNARSIALAANQVGCAMEQVAESANQQAEHTSAASATIHELVDAIGQIASGAQQQADQAQQATVTVTSMVRAMEGVARHASEVSDAAEVAASSARRGAEVVEQTLEGMNRIRDQVMTAANRMEDLNQHSRRIGEIMQVITDISEQTNLLALNAAIEAARAGEQGRGFAVVAEEVRKLAERSAHSSKEIRTLIKSIQSGIAEAVSAINYGVRDVESGSALASTAGTALEDILSTVGRTSDGIQSITAGARQVLSSTLEVAKMVQEVAAVSEENSAATQEMAAGAQQVSQLIGQVQKVSESNSAAAEEVSASLTEVKASMNSIANTIGDLVRISDLLNQLVAQFKVDDSAGAGQTDAVPVYETDDLTADEWGADGLAETAADGEETPADNGAEADRAPMGRVAATAQAETGDD